MSYSPALDSPVTHAGWTRRDLTAAAVAVALAAIGLTVYGAHDLREIVVVIAVLTAAIVGIYGFLLPRKLAGESAGGTALTLSLLAALLLLPAFWSGLPLALGVAGAILGYAGRKSVRGSARCIAALVLGTLASIGYFAVYVLDTLVGSGGA